MKRSTVVFAILCCGCFIFMLCTPKSVINPGASDQQTCPPLTEAATTDTLMYTISFPDSVYRREFIGSFRSFINHYQFTARRSDSTARKVLIRMLPSSVEGKDSNIISPLEPAWITETTIENREFPGDSAFPGFEDTIASVIDTILPDTGGKLRVHMQRTGIDETFMELLSIDPFTADGPAVSPLLGVDAPSPKKIIITLNGKVTDGRGRLVSALDLIEAWTMYIKKHPAEGFALFRHVEGVMEFIQGKEAVVRGFGASDQQTCYLRLNQPDPEALHRITTARLCGIYSRLGRYYPVHSSAQEIILVANRRTSISRLPFLDTLFLNITDDQNPILSFSLRKYDAITLTFLTDISYARTTFEKQADLQNLSHDRYFISCAIDDLTTRRYLWSQVKGAEFLQTTVKAEGIPITALTADSLQRTDTVATGDAVPPGDRQIQILFRKDDQVSRKIAEKLLADLSGSGIHSSLIAADIIEYERLLIERKYDCAVGWVHERVTTDLSEQLRLATIFFKDMFSEQERIDGFWELPLFSINRYLLVRKPAGLYHGSLGGIYASARQVTTSENGHQAGSTEDDHPVGMFENQ